MLLASHPNSLVCISWPLWLHAPCCHSSYPHAVLWMENVAGVTEFDVGPFMLQYFSVCSCQSISIVFFEVTCHSFPFLLLDLIPAGHMVAFTMGAFIKAELSKTKLFILGPFKYSLYKRACWNHKWGNVVIHIILSNPHLNLVGIGDHFSWFISYTGSQISLVLPSNGYHWFIFPWWTWKTPQWSRAVLTCDFRFNFWIWVEFELW